MIRLAVADDAGAIAQVHVRTWQSAYRGLLPDVFLDGLGSSMERRTDSWRRALASPDIGVRTWIAEREGNIVGFLTTGPNRDLGPEVGELRAIYVLPEFARQGIGGLLMDRALHDFQEAGFGTATLWVLTRNASARAFYERAGWVSDGASKVEQHPACELHETRYGIKLGKRRPAPGTQTGEP